MRHPAYQLGLLWDGVHILYPFRLHTPPSPSFLSKSSLQVYVSATPFILGDLASTSIWIAVLLLESVSFSRSCFYCLASAAPTSNEPEPASAEVCYIDPTENEGFVRNRPIFSITVPSLFGLTGKSNISNPLSTIDASSLIYLTVLDPASETNNHGRFQCWGRATRRSIRRCNGFFCIGLGMWIQYLGRMALSTCITSKRPHLTTSSLTSSVA